MFWVQNYSLKMYILITNLILLRLKRTGWWQNLERERERERGLVLSDFTFLGDEYLLTLFFIYSDFSHIISLHVFQACFKLTARYFTTKLLWTLLWSKMMVRLNCVRMGLVLSTVALGAANGTLLRNKRKPTRLLRKLYVFTKKLTNEKFLYWSGN